ncbi:hypothetical protein [Hoeflea sp. TYP-13]|uniref:hypothetical protein n=1 Tax=Hoeflea sp. TYP-13 TaxID=3230023 RepID=UPI0034C67D99
MERNAAVALTARPVSCAPWCAVPCFTEAHIYEPYIEGFESIVVLREHTPPVGG